MSVRFFPGQEFDRSKQNRNGYESSFPGGVCARYGHVINNPLSASRAGLSRIQLINAAADLDVSLRMAPVNDPEYRAKTDRFKQMFTSSAVPVGVRWWFAGGNQPVQPVLQDPSHPLPPVVYDN
jgi:hypothetical protein